jgi:hypothetical protein
MAGKKAREEKAVKVIEKAVKKAMHKGVPEQVVERAVDRAIKRGAEHKKAKAKDRKAETGKPLKDSKVGESAKKKSKSEERREVAE